jgi:hypothetical protein
MKPTISVLLVALVVVAAAASSAQAAGNANFVLGGRAMTSSSDWEPFDSQGLAGVTVDFGPATWPINFETGVQGSAWAESDYGFYGEDVTASVSEIFFGVNKTWNPHGGKMHPFVGGGAASVTAKLEDSSVSVDDSSAGVYVHGGIFWRLGARFNIGFDVRVLGGTNMTIAGMNFDANYSQAGIVLGWGWPRRK